MQRTLYNDYQSSIEDQTSIIVAVSIQETFKNWTHSIPATYEDQSIK